MAISRHDPEWKRVVFMALAGGVEFQCGGRLSHFNPVHVWYASVPGQRIRIVGQSKYDVARKAVHMMAETEFLPDAAKTRGDLQERT